MGIIQLRRPWTEQPQNAADINWEHPFFSSSSSAYVYHAPSRSLFFKNQTYRGIVINAGSVNNVFKKGNVATSHGASSRIDLVQPIRARHTVLTAAGTFVMSSQGATDIYTGFQYIVDGAVQFGTGSGPATTSRRSWSFAAPRFGQIIVPHVSGMENAPSVYVDGSLAVVSAGSGEGTGYNWGTSAINLQLGWDVGNNTYYAAGTLYASLIVGVSATNINANILSEVSANPWQLFEPRCIYIPLAATTGSRQLHSIIYTGTDPSNDQVGAAKIADGKNGDGTSATQQFHLDWNGSPHVLDPSATLTPGAAYKGAATVYDPSTSTFSNVVYTDWSQASGSGVNLTGVNSSQANTSSTNTITQVQVLTGVNSSQANTSSTNTITQVQVLTGANSSQANTSSTNTITQVQVLAGVNSSQANTSSTNTITQIQVLAGVNSSQVNTSSTNTITQIQVLAGVNSSQVNASSTNTVTQVQVLVGVNSSQPNSSSTGSILGDVTLIGVNSSQSNNSSANTVTQVQVLAGVSSSQSNSSSANTVTQVQVLVGVNSSQPNSSSTGSILGDVTLIGVNSSQVNTSSTNTITQVQLITGVNSSQVNSSSANTVTQVQVLVGANSNQPNTSSTAAIAFAIVLTGTNSNQVNSSSTDSVNQVHEILGISSSQASTSSQSSITQIHSLVGVDCAQAANSPAGRLGGSADVLGARYITEVLQRYNVVIDRHDSIFIKVA